MKQAREKASIKKQARRVFPLPMPVPLAANILWITFLEDVGVEFASFGTEDRGTEYTLTMLLLRCQAALTLISSLTEVVTDSILVQAHTARYLSTSLPPPVIPYDISLPEYPTTWDDTTPSPQDVVFCFCFGGLLFLL